MMAQIRGSMERVSSEKAQGRINAKGNGGVVHHIPGRQKGEDKSKGQGPNSGGKGHGESLDGSGQGRAYDGEIRGGQGQENALGPGKTSGREKLPRGDFGEDKPCQDPKKKRGQDHGPDLLPLGFSLNHFPQGEGGGKKKEGEEEGPRRQTRRSIK